MSIALLLLAAQASAWTISPRVVTIGDTIQVTRRFATTPDVWVRLRSLEPTFELEPLAPPRWAHSEGELTIVYTVAAFTPGRHAVAMPDIEFVHAGGELQIVVGDTAWIEIESVLPSGDSTVTPMPSQAPVARHRTTTTPLAGLVATFLLSTAAWVAVRRRRGRRPRFEEPDESVPGSPIDIWVASGESRAVAAVMADRLRDVIAERIPGAGRHLHTEECIEAVLESDHGDVGRQVAEVLRALERARFSPAAPGDVLEVVDLAEAAIAMLETPLGKS